jgi:hypothetical protein
LTRASKSRRPENSSTLALTGKWALSRAALLVEAGGLEAGGHLLLDHLEDDVLRALAVQGAVADAVDDLALLVEHVVILEQALADGKILLLNLLLGRLDGAVEPRVLKLLALVHRAFHDAGS